MNFFITAFENTPDCIVIRGYSPSPPTILDSTIERTTYDDYFARTMDSHEGLTLVCVSQNEHWKISVDMTLVDFSWPNFWTPTIRDRLQKQFQDYESMQEKPSVPATQLISKNILCDQAYFGLNPIVCMTWLGMLTPL